MKDAVRVLSTLVLTSQGEASKEVVLWQIHPVLVKSKHAFPELSQLKVSDIEQFCSDTRLFLAVTVDDFGARPDFERSVAWFGWSRGSSDAGIFSERADVELAYSGEQMFVLALQGRRVALDLHAYLVDLSSEQERLRNVHLLPWQSWRPDPSAQYSFTLHEHGPCLFDELSVMSVGDSLLLNARASAANCQSERYLMMSQGPEEAWVWEEVEVQEVSRSSRD